LLGATTSKKGIDMCKCQVCGKDYKTDILISDELWEKIKPTEKSKGVGLLCPSCIGNRIEMLPGYRAFQLIEAI